MLQCSATGVKTFDLRSAPGELVMRAVWNDYDSIRLRVSWHGAKAAQQIQSSSKCIFRVLPSFDPQLEAEHKTKHQEPWTTFVEVFINHRHEQNAVTVLPSALCYVPSVTAAVFCFRLFQWLCLTSVFPTNLFFFFLSLFILDIIYHDFLSAPLRCSWMYCGSTVQ